MSTQPLQALAALKATWAPTSNDVWHPVRSHVEGFQDDILHSLLHGVRQAEEEIHSSPIGVVIQGQRGTGKTHLLAWLRQRVQADGGYFFLLTVNDSAAFWRSTALSIIEGLNRPTADGELQLRHFLRRIVVAVDTPATAQAALTAAAPLSRQALDAFIESLRRFDRVLGLECQDTARALALLGSDLHDAQDVGNDFLTSSEEQHKGERSAWGIRRGSRTPQEIVKDVSRLLAVTGPTVIAVDQIDPIIQQSAALVGRTIQESWRQGLVLDQIAAGLMSLREITQRTLTIVSCLPLSWQMIKSTATDTAADRFRETEPLRLINNPAILRSILEGRFGPCYRSADFEPDYPTWPITLQALDQAPALTPRQLIERADAHVQHCLARQQVTELNDLSPVTGEALTDPAAAADELVIGRLEEQFQRWVAQSPITDTPDSQDEDEVIPGLLAAGLEAWIRQSNPTSKAFTFDREFGAKPALHARLRLTISEETEDEIHWAFRAITAPNAVAAQNRLRNAVTAAGIAESSDTRKLVILRSTPWSQGSRTREIVDAFESSEGITTPVGTEDLQILHALRGMLDENPEGLDAWLARQQPVQKVTFLSNVLESATALAHAVQNTATGPKTMHPVRTHTPSIHIGNVIDENLAFTIELESLRRHVTIFAGSGSGKTVLIRRIVEECALQGVSAIVLDPNNDLARLGQPWPQRPQPWTDQDAAKASDYLDNTDVVVWTPRRNAGKPLSFHPLPDFKGIVDDADEFGAAIDVAVGSLAPQAKVDGDTAKALRARAVLREALAEYTRRGGSGLRGFIGMLSGLPEGVSSLDNADKIAADLAQTLTAAMVNDPLFGGAGEPIDPGVLLRPANGKRARVSVISLVGLPSDEQRQSFVNQLQMALFAWIKRNPVGDRPLGGLLVIDEAQTFAPSGPMTACTMSTLALASQARKYGLGLVFATQAPKGIHNRIPGNALTQFFGKLNAPAQIEAARALAKAKGSDIPDISRLRAGQFYASTEGTTFAKIEASLCLTYHPPSPLTVEEVVALAAADPNTHGHS